MFERLREGNVWDERPLLTVYEVLVRKVCIFCYEMGKAIVLKFKTSDVAIQQELVKLEVHNYGPYYLEMDMLNELSPGLLGKYGRQNIDPDDLRLAQTSKPTRNRIVDTESRVRIVVYLVLTAPPGSLLRDHFPELDSYKTSGTTDKSTVHVFNRGVRRVALDDGSGLLQPTIGVQLEIQYENDKTGLLSLTLGSIST